MTYQNKVLNQVKPVERVCIKYDPNKNLPTHKYLIPNQIYKEFKEMVITVCFNNKANHNLTTSQEESIQWNFRLGHKGFQHVQWLIQTGNI